MSETVKVAIVQSAPVLFDLESTMNQVEAFTSSAARAGAKLVLFPEAFVGGYPRGLSFGCVVGDRSDWGRELWLRYSKSCPLVGGVEFERIGAMAAEHQVWLVIGVVEREVSGSLYCSILYFSPEGQLAGRHRKLKPTASERLIWADAKVGDALAVVDTDFAKIGGLVCWENYMPLARMALYQQGVQIYVAPTADQRDRWQHSMIHIALEGRCFVMSTNQFVTQDSYPKDLLASDELQDLPNVVCRGGSMVVGPMGELVVPPVWDREELIFAELDLDEVQKAKMDFDVVGHYERGDVFDFSVKKI